MPKRRKVHKRASAFQATQRVSKKRRNVQKGTARCLLKRCVAQ